MELEIASNFGIQSVYLQKPLTITALDGRPLGSGQVSHCTTFLQFKVSEHNELMQFFLIQSPELPLVKMPLGYIYNLVP